LNLKHVLFYRIFIDEILSRDFWWVFNISVAITFLINLFILLFYFSLVIACWKISVGFLRNDWYKMNIGLVFSVVVSNAILFLRCNVHLNIFSSNTELYLTPYPRCCVVWFLLNGITVLKFKLITRVILVWVFAWGYFFSCFYIVDVDVYQKNPTSVCIISHPKRPYYWRLSFYV